MALCSLLSVPLQHGAGYPGCDMGPAAYRAAGLPEALAALGHEVVDAGTVVPAKTVFRPHTNPAVRNLAEISAWIEAIGAAVRTIPDTAIPILLGGDHAMGAGVLPAMAERAAKAGKPFFVLWLDAHTDCHTLETTTSGNLHGVPIAYAVGDPSFAGAFPPLTYPVDPANICLMGMRSVDPAERSFVARTPITVHDMRAIDENGVTPLVRAFIERVAAAGGHLHVSIDVDFLDPEIAPGVGTTVPGGATFREAHLIMEMLHDSGLVTSLDLAELNPFLDVRGRTAVLMSDLAASLMGRRVLDRPTRSTL